MIVIPRSYHCLLRHRRDFLEKEEIAPVMYYKDDPAGGYLLYLQDGVFLNECSVQGDDITHFEANVKKFCNFINPPGCIEFCSHDLSDTSDWIHGASNSLFSIRPIAASTLKLIRTVIKLDRDVIFNSPFKFVIWQSKDGVTPVPEYVSGTKTEFGPQEFMPVGENPVYTGWHQAKPDYFAPIAEDQKQEFTVWAYLENGVPTLQATEFKYPNLWKARSKSVYERSSKETDDSNTIELQYDYFKYKLNLFLRSSLNERIELYIEDDSPFLLTGDVQPDKPTTISFLFASYDEW